MSVKQLSVFAENKPGAVAEIIDVLVGEGIDIRAMNVADTQDFGILRLIVSDAEKAKGALANGGCVVSVTGCDLQWKWPISRARSETSSIFLRVIR